MYLDGLPLHLMYTHADVHAVESRKRANPSQFSRPSMPATAPAKQAARNFITTRVASFFFVLATMHNLPDGRKINVGVLGATGTVGQRFILLLSEHPYFVIHALGASQRSAGKPYSKAVTWKQTKAIPAVVREMAINECKPEFFAECAVVFSGLDAEVAGDIEAAFRAAELAVFSNAKNFRRDPNVPLIVPLVNTSHLSMIPQQRALCSPPLKKGFIVTNANCSTTGFVVPLAALEKAFGPIESCIITTMQAISGAGYPAARRRRWSGRR
ncbi:hypothetical protein NM688_g8915 [Phlebia brevispora]|uniref:Uncharacterized protein n=1 Tax=Phlebia brevispora TaxID=194682 RepID=A0ACC1RNF2_9APHY|nr:hypothetical protein NM688_g8915 [Phlebia brevispora]